MGIATLPDAVITRLRAQCPLFANRVAGTAGEARAAENSELPVPHAFYMPGGIEPTGDDELSTGQTPMDQRVNVRFRVMIAVDNTGDDRGQGGATGLMVATAAVTRALVGWNPESGVFAPVFFDGLEDAFDNNKARLWGTLVFRTDTMTSQL